jgi:hypothetical protein
MNCIVHAYLRRQISENFAALTMSVDVEIAGSYY